MHVIFHLMQHADGYSEVDDAAIVAKATLSAARELGLTNRELALILGSSEASISRLGGDRALRTGSAETALALLFLRLFRSLDAVTGGDSTKARAWLAGPNRHLGGVPAERIRTVEGLVDVVQYLDAIRGKL